MAWVFLLSLGLLAYVFLGYPWLLRAIVRLRGARPVRKAPVEPTVTLVVSAFNEAAVIGKKIENGLALDYPLGKLTIAVVSDASDDGTDDIVRSYAGRGVRLFRQEERRGKTAGLNAVVPRLTSEVVVFSDANAMYEPGAVRALVQNFADPDVGCVTGEARYLKEGATAADEGERTYWNYEIQIKRLETAVGSVVGGDGAIYAIRRELWRNLPENAINDFLNPLQIVAAGWRGVYEPDAVCWEETAGGTGREYRRRVRIVSRSWRAVFQAPGVLNPFRVEFFSVSLLSHKVLRWLSGVLALVMVSSAALWLASHPAAHTWTALGAAAVASLLLVLPAGRRLLQLATYFGVINVASFVGIVKGSLGRVSGTWAPPRIDVARPPRPWLRFSVVAVCVSAVLYATYLVSLEFGRQALHWLFWAAATLLVYIYAVYPLVLAAWRRLAARPPDRAAATPRVCLFITAHNEAEVIAEKVRNALALDYPRERLDIVVASDGSTDGTNAIVERYVPDGVRLLAFPVRQGKIGAINSGITAVDADIVVFSDANTFLRPDALRALVQPFADPTVGGVSGDVVLVGERA
ncbi:MAG: glycosyltransferase, partial [Vicinamibacteraceae bacterium]|nr:glycosyltransferase [Vicinamibacteraceae bacterium]